MVASGTTSFVACSENGRQEDEAARPAAYHVYLELEVVDEFVVDQDVAAEDWLDWQALSGTPARDTGDGRGRDKTSERVDIALGVESVDNVEN